MPSSSGFPCASLAALLALLPCSARVGQDEEARAETRPADLAELLASFAALPGLEVSFEEEKHLALLALPLESAGKLYFLPPGWLAREVTAPEPALIRITPTELGITDRDGTSTLDLRQNEGLRVFVTSLVMLFAGDRPGLERAFTLAYEPAPEDAARWTLTLVPRAKPLTDMLTSLTIRGADRGVKAIELREPNGDRTVTTVVSADPRRRFGPEEKERLFGIRAGG
jgi:hypothetical protein